MWANFRDLCGKVR